MSRRIRDDFEGVVHYGGGTLKAGDEIPAGVVFGEHLLDGSKDGLFEEPAPVDTDDDDKPDYDALHVPELKAEIEKRNEDRDDDAKIAPEAPGNKPELIAALQADDAKSDS